MIQHPNDASREAQPGLWIFQGVSVVWLVFGVAAFVAIFRILAPLIDWPVNIVISILPLSVITLLIWLLRNKPKRYADDMLLLVLWRLKQNELWIGGGEIIHPKEY